jgi:Flp pilus assembly protein TadD
MQIPDFDAALEVCRIAYRLAPNSSEGLFALAIAYRWRGQFDLSTEHLEKACQLDPLSHTFYFECGLNHLWQRNYSRAEEYYDKAIHLAPDIIAPHLGKSMLYLYWKGDIWKARSNLSEAPENFEPILHFGVGFNYNLYPLGIIDGNYTEALDQLSQVSGEIIENVLYFSTKAQLEAQIFGLMGDEKRKIERNLIALEIICNLMKNDPDNPRYHSAIGIVYAGLGRKEEALCEGERAVELKNLMKEMWKGNGREEDLARIYTMTGEYEKALDKIEYLLDRPGTLSPALLRIHPDWKPLRGFPRFKALLIEKISN